jgi:hypothetical protein
MLSQPIRNVLWISRALALFAFLLWCGDARALPPSVQERERARSLMDQGDARLEAGAYEAALEAYRAADAIMAVPTTGIEVGRTLEKLGRLLQAREALQRVATSPTLPDEPKAFAAARQKAERLAVELTPRIPRLRIIVVGVPSDMEVALSIDGKRLEAHKLGVALEMEPGAHRVSGRAPGQAEVTRDVALAEGELQEVTLIFTTQSAPSSPAAAQLATAERPANERGAPATRGKRVLLWGSLGLAAVGITAGTITGLRSLSLTSDVKERCREKACPAETKDDIAAAKTLANVSNVAVGVGVAALAVGVWQLLSPATEAKPKATRAAPRVAVGVGALGVEGAF